MAFGLRLRRARYASSSTESDRTTFLMKIIAMNRTTTARQTGRRSIWMRSLAVLMVWLSVLQPTTALAAIAQEPLFSVTAVPPNVMLMMDDSNSMREYVLPLPGGINLPGPVCKVDGSGPNDGVWVNTRLGGRCISLEDDWKIRAPALNPLWYNPAVTYRPWNDNNKAGTANFPQAGWGGSTAVANPADLTPWDLRKWPATVEPYYTPSTTRVTTNTGTIGSAAQVLDPGGGRYIRYPGMPGEGASGVDLFTGTIGFTCDLCLSYDQVPIYGPLPPCLGYVQVPVYGPLPPCNTFAPENVYGPGTCTAYQQIPQYGPLPACLAYQQIPVITCILVPDAGEESGFRQVCSITSYVDGNCTNQPPAPIIGYTDGACIAETPGPVIGTTMVCIDQPPADIIGYTNGACNNQPPADIVGYNNGQCNAYNPADATCPLANRNYTSGAFAPARHFRFIGTPGQEDIPAQYELIDIDRTVNLGDMFPVVDAVTGQPAASRTDCANAASCTFTEEAKNFANWYTYYRNRLFAAIAVTSQSLSELIGTEQQLRFGFGRINRFPRAPNAWDPPTAGNPGTRFGVTPPTIDNNNSASPTAVEYGVRPFTVGSADRQRVFDWLFGLQWTGSTPNREALSSAGAYFSRADNYGPWAEDPSVGQPASEHLWCRRNFTLLATDGEWTRVNPPITPKPQPRMEDAATVGIDLDPIPVSFGTVLNSDSVTGTTITGSNRRNPSDLYSYSYVPANEPWFAGGSSGQTNTLTDVAKYFWANDLRADLPNRFDRALPKRKAFWQHMVNYIIGYGVRATFDNSSNRTILNNRAGTIDWPSVGLEDCRIVDLNSDDTNQTVGGCGTIYPALTPASGYGHRANDTFRAAMVSEGDFYSASSPETLRASIKAALANILADPAAGTAPSVSNTSVAPGNLIIESSFRTDIWDGRVEAYDSQELVDWLGAGGTKPLPEWSANFPAATARQIFTAESRTQQREFVWTELTPLQKDAVDSFSFTLGAGSSPVLNWLRGDASLEQRNGGTLRSRPDTVLGDIVNSTPQYSKAIDHGYFFGPEAAKNTTPPSGSASYRIPFLQNKKNSRNAIAMFGANDGMFHVLDARVGETTSGQEIFAYVPRSQYVNLNELTNPNYGHRYYVDGPVIEGDVWNGTQWKTIAIGTTGGGAAGIFALDITDPQPGQPAGNISLLWDNIAADHPSPGVSTHLGNVMHPGKIGSVRDSSASNGFGRWVYIVGNGYESTSNEASLLIFDALTGLLVKKIDTFRGSAASPNGLGAISPVYDGARNIVAVYAGDKLGNLWKFDLSKADKAEWKITLGSPFSPEPMFQATDSGGVAQPITTAPRVTPHPQGGLYVVFGTGKLFEVGDPSTLQVQSIYALRDRNVTATILKSALQEIRMEQFDVDGNVNTQDDVYRRLNTADVNAFTPSQSGFYIDLRATGVTPNGERIIASPILDAGVVALTSYSPTSLGDRCVPGGVSFLYRIDVSSRFSQAAYPGQGALVVGKQSAVGTAGGFQPMYDGIDPSGLPPVHQMSEADVKSMMNSPKYKILSGKPVVQGTVGACSHVGILVDGNVASIPTICAGLLPLRSWRPVR